MNDTTPDNMTVATRFAPSPSGHLHVGGARTALLNWAFARGRGGTFILRIEDTDQRRSSESASTGFLRDLRWLGIEWDEGPEFGGCGGGEHGPYFQSQRLDVYHRYLQQLIDEGKAYYAFETPEELQVKREAARSLGENYAYDRAALELSPEQVQQYLDEDRPAVVRIKAPDGEVVIRDEVLGETVIAGGEIDDFVIRKTDGFPTYHFAVVVDDALMKVTHVLRAQEHYKNTARHLILQEALGFERPMYGHLSVIVNPDNSKMSKRDKDKTLRRAIKEQGLEGVPKGVAIESDEFLCWLGDKDRQLETTQAEALAEGLGVDLPEINVDDFRRSGYLPDVLCNFLALNGWSPGEDIEKFDLDFLVERFGLDRVQKAPAKFDRVKLLSFNHDAVQALEPGEFVRLVREQAEAYHPGFLDRFSDEQFDLLARCNQKRSKTLEDPIRESEFLLIADDAVQYAETKAVRKAMRRGRDHLIAMRSILADIKGFSPENLEEVIGAYAEREAEGKLGLVAQPLRIAVTGTTISPPIHDTLVLLGRDSVLVRIDRCLALNVGAPVE